MILDDNNIPAMRLIIEEAAAIMKAWADHVLAEAGSDDYRSKIAACIMLDHVKKLALVHGMLIEKKQESELKIADSPNSPRHSPRELV